jgi:hypothetical protein
MKYKKRQWTVEHSEEFPNGRTLVMKIGDSSKSDWDVDIIAYEVDDPSSPKFEIINSKELNPGYLYPGGIDSLSSEDRRKAVKHLFLYGITDGR